MEGVIKENRPLILDSKPEQFVVGSKTKQSDDIINFVNPYQQKIVLDVALHAPLVYAVQLVRAVFHGNTACLLKSLGHCFQSKEF